MLVQTFIFKFLYSSTFLFPFNIKDGIVNASLCMYISIRVCLFAQKKYEHTHTTFTLECFLWTKKCPNFHTFHSFLTTSM